MIIHSNIKYSIRRTPGGMPFGIVEYTIQDPKKHFSMARERRGYMQDVLWAIGTHILLDINQNYPLWTQL